MVADTITTAAVVITTTTAAEVISMGLVNIAVEVADAALATAADINTTHIRDIMTPAHLATVLADASTAEEQVSRPHIKSSRYKHSI